MCVNVERDVPDFVSNLMFNVRSLQLEDTLDGGSSDLVMSRALRWHIATGRMGFRRLCFREWS